MKTAIKTTENKLRDLMMCPVSTARRTVLDRDCIPGVQSGFTMTELAEMQTLLAGRSDAYGVTVRDEITRAISYRNRKAAGC